MIAFFNFWLDGAPLVGNGEESGTFRFWLDGAPLIEGGATAPEVRSFRRRCFITMF